jgi:hypothetical protein
MASLNDIGQIGLAPATSGKKSFEFGTIQEKSNGRKYGLDTK